MSEKSFRGLMLPGAVLAACALLSSCAQQPVSPEARAAAARGAALRQIEGRYQLDRSFQDFYDTAFVLTGDGAAAPRVVDLAQLADALSAFDVVFYGERHSHPGVHLQQMKLLRALVERDPHWILSFEQFERDVQSIVDDYLARRVGETTLIDKGRAWNNYAVSYRPLLLFARAHQLPVVAAEAPGWEISCVGQWGPAILDRFTPLERSWVAAEVHVEPGAYQDKFMDFMGTAGAHGSAKTGTPESAAKAQRSFAAQVARDDTMAESIERALEQHPGYKALHLTGSFHSEAFLGTVERLRMLDPKLNVAVIEPVEVEDPHAPAFDSDSLKDGTVLQLVYPSPDSFADGEETAASLKDMAHPHHPTRCKYSPPSAQDAVHPPARSP
ncbi:MAG TPA: ChaN family lipoprotein [Steroidobacteraceae bacterium]|nr:ChaN family lipoprotein [Steroidobacteraceae bacterium]